MSRQAGTRSSSPARSSVVGQVVAAWHQHDELRVGCRDGLPSHAHARARRAAPARRDRPPALPSRGPSDRQPSADQAIPGRAPAAPTLPPRAQPRRPVAPQRVGQPRATLRHACQSRDRGDRVNESRPPCAAQTTRRAEPWAACAPRPAHRRRLPRRRRTAPGSAPGPARAAP